MDPTTDLPEQQKRVAALAAVAEVRDGMIVGLGTGSTARFAIEAIGAQGLEVRAVATSRRTAELARSVGIEMIDLPADGVIDLAIDGVDEIDASLRAIKGAGGALLREKVVARAARRMIAIADASKPVAAIGAKPVPLEVLPFAQGLVEREVIALGGVPVVRDAVSDQGNLLIDCGFSTFPDPAGLAAALSAIPGVLGHGLFLDEIDILYVGTEDGEAVKRVRATPDSLAFPFPPHP